LHDDLEFVSVFVIRKGVGQVDQQKYDVSPAKPKHMDRYSPASICMTM
jgi:hypothetical protein